MQNDKPDDDCFLLCSITALTSSISNFSLLTWFRILNKLLLVRACVFSSLGFLLQCIGYKPYSDSYRKCELAASSSLQQHLNRDSRPLSYGIYCWFYDAVETLSLSVLNEALFFLCKQGPIHDQKNAQE